VKAVLFQGGLTISWREETMAIRSQPILASDDCSSDLPTEPIYRLSVAQYHAMARTGILTEDDPVELLEGWLVRKMTKNRPHTVVTRRLRSALERILPADWYVESQEPVTTADSEPEPDVLVVRAELRDNLERQPGPEDVALVVEVADSSLRLDRGTKKRIYARAGIPVYWIVNLIEQQIEVYIDPSGPQKRRDYRRRQDYGPSDAIPVVLHGVEVGRIPARELLP
jgi:Uma2 family endonuclease